MPVILAQQARVAKVQDYILNLKLAWATLDSVFKKKKRGEVKRKVLEYKPQDIVAGL